MAAAQKLLVLNLTLTHHWQKMSHFSHQIRITLLFAVLFCVVVARSTGKPSISRHEGQSPDTGIVLRTGQSTVVSENDLQNDLQILKFLLIYLQKQPFQTSTDKNSGESIKCNSRPAFFLAQLFCFVSIAIIYKLYNICSVGF